MQERPATDPQGQTTEDVLLFNAWEGRMKNTHSTKIVNFAVRNAAGFSPSNPFSSGGFIAKADGGIAKTEAAKLISEALKKLHGVALSVLVDLF